MEKKKKKANAEHTVKFGYVLGMLCSVRHWFQSICALKRSRTKYDDLYRKLKLRSVLFINGSEMLFTTFNAIYYFAALVLWRRQNQMSGGHD